MTNSLKKSQKANIRQKMTEDTHLQEKDIDKLKKRLIREGSIDDCSWIHTGYKRDGEIYVGGNFFGKINKENRLVKILTEEDSKLQDNEENLFDILFDGNIYRIEQSLDYSLLLTFTSNNSGALSVFYQPKKNDFYVAPRIIKKAYKLTPENNAIETELPGFSFDGIEDYKNWIEQYKI